MSLLLAKSAGCKWTVIFFNKVDVFQVYEKAKLCNWLFLLFLIQYQFTNFNSDSQSESYLSMPKSHLAMQQPENQFLGLAKFSSRQAGETGLEQILALSLMAGAGIHWRLWGFLRLVWLLAPGMRDAAQAASVDSAPVISFRAVVSSWTMKQTPLLNNTGQSQNALSLQCFRSQCPTLYFAFVRLLWWKIKKQLLFCWV